MVKAAVLQRPAACRRVLRRPAALKRPAAAHGQPTAWRTFYTERVAGQLPREEFLEKCISWIKDSVENQKVSVVKQRNETGKKAKY